MTIGRDELAARLEQIQGGKCFICEDSVNRAVEKYEIDHIVPRAKGGKNDENNYALVHDRCNRSKLDSDLRVARCMARYEKVKAQYIDKGPNRPNLGDFLAQYNGSKLPVGIRFVDGTVEVRSPDRAPLQLPLYVDKLSGVKSFLAEFSLEYVFHDVRINPRAVGDRIRGLIEEFLSGRPQLHPALGWVQTPVDGGEVQVFVFDGQHKAVAQMLLGVRTLLVRVFVNPDLNILLEANTNAGTVLRQVAFDKAVQRFLGSQILTEKIDAFRKATHRAGDDLSFSELDLVRFFRGEHPEMKRYITDNMRTAVIHDPQNKLRDYVEFSGRTADKPLSYNSIESIEKTFFSLFICQEPLANPMNHRLEVGENPRQLEKEQLVQLMNVFAEEVLIRCYDADRGTYRIEESLRKGDEVADAHLRAVRLCREELLYNMLKYVGACISQFFLTAEGRVVDQDKMFQVPFPTRLWENIRRVIHSIGCLPVWVNKDPNLSSSVFGGKQTYDFWEYASAHGETTSGYRLLAKPLNLNDLLRP